MVAGGWVVASGEWWRGTGWRGNGWRIRESRIPNRGIGGAGNGVRETGIRKRIRGIAESRKRGFGIDGCAHFVCTECQEFGEFTPEPRNPAPETPPETPELANNYGFRSLAGTLAPEL